MSSSPKAFVQVAAIIGVTEALRRAGCNPDKICQAVGLQPADLRDPDASIPLPAYLNLLELAARRSGDDCFGLRFGDGYDPGNYGALGFVALNSPTIGAGLLNVGRYLGVMRDHCRVVLEVENRLARLRYRLAAGSARCWAATGRLARSTSSIRCRKTARRIARSSAPMCISASP